MMQELRKKTEQIAARTDEKNDLYDSCCASRPSSRTPQARRAGDAGGLHPRTRRRAARYASRSSTTSTSRSTTPRTRAPRSFRKACSSSTDSSLDTLGRLGLEPIDAEGQPFDPELHDAGRNGATEEVPDQHGPQRFSSAASSSAIASSTCASKGLRPAVTAAADDTREDPHGQGHRHRPGNDELVRRRDGRRHAGHPQRGGYKTTPSMVGGHGDGRAARRSDREAPGDHERREHGLRRQAAHRSQVRTRRRCSTPSSYVQLRDHEVGATATCASRPRHATYRPRDLGDRPPAR